MVQPFSGRLVGRQKHVLSRTANRRVCTKRCPVCLASAFVLGAMCSTRLLPPAILTPLEATSRLETWATQTYAMYTLYTIQWTHTHTRARAHYVTNRTTLGWHVHTQSHMPEWASHWNQSHSLSSRSDKEWGGGLALPCLEFHNTTYKTLNAGVWSQVKSQSGRPLNRTSGNKTNARVKNRGNTLQQEVTTLKWTCSAFHPGWQHLATK